MTFDDKSTPNDALEPVERTRDPHELFMRDMTNIALVLLALGMLGVVGGAGWLWGGGAALLATGGCALGLSVLIMWTIKD